MVIMIHAVYRARKRYPMHWYTAAGILEQVIHVIFKCALLSPILLCRGKIKAGPAAALSILYRAPWLLDISNVKPFIYTVFLITCTTNSGFFCCSDLTEQPGRSRRPHSKRRLFIAGIRAAFSVVSRQMEFSVYGLHTCRYYIFHITRTAKWRHLGVAR